MAPIFSAPISPERIVLTGIITLGSGIQLILFARRVFFAREEYGVKPPAITGHPDFERIYRAQQDCLDWQPVFMALLWTSAIFFHPGPSAIGGVLYIIARQRYFNGYCQSVEDRLPATTQGRRALKMMSIMAAIGLGRTLVRIVLNQGQHRGWWEGPPASWRFVQ